MHWLIRREKSWKTPRWAGFGKLALFRTTGKLPPFFIASNANLTHGNLLISTLSNVIEPISQSLLIWVFFQLFSLRISQCICYWQLHVRLPHLSDYSPVLILYSTVQYALWCTTTSIWSSLRSNNHFASITSSPLIHKSSTVDGYLFSHNPVGMI